ncbi:MAG: flavin reductase [Oscillospiraceae bacterium]|nr:flavin reductase [Oscillospiraceae bacterium]
MYCIKKVKEDTYWVGGSDRRIALFENVFPVSHGMSYNAYMVVDEKTVLLDTVDKAISTQFFENLEHVLAGKPLDYVIINHMEPDHCATLDELVLRYPGVKIVGNAKTLAMIKQFFTFEIDSRIITVAEGDTLCTGRHTFSFAMAPMVHWPETMVTYDTTDKVLYSADAFGTFGAINGNLFADEVNFERDWLDDARRYYTNIVGKYGTQVQALLKKAAALDIEIICPLHGPVWRKNISWFIEKYQKWSTYTPEENAVMIAYASVYGNTENAANILAGKLADAGVHNIVMYDVSATHPSIIVAESFRCSHLVFASTTYNAGIFCNMETALLDLKAHNLQNRTVALIENGSWGCTAGRLMSDIFSAMKNISLIEQTTSIKSSVKDAQLQQLESLAQRITQSMFPPQEQASVVQKIDASAMFKLSYGLFMLSAKDGAKDNGCIINTVTQVTDSPKQIAVAVNKKNYTHDMIVKTGMLNISVLSEEAPFKVFEHFGFQSGRDVNKFENCETQLRTQNGLLYLPQYANAVISGKVVSMQDLGTHTLFITEVTEAHILSDVPSATYAYYFANIKPKPQPAAQEKKGFVSKICGYVYEGDTLPEDYICPLCKHGAEDFEPLK